MSEYSLSRVSLPGVTEPQREPRRRRQPAMSPEDRRAAIIDAALPLLREQGANVSTRQIADAAGVAEGTIFGVFSDKASLIKCAIMRALDPSESIEAIEAIDRGLELRVRLTRAAEILHERSVENSALMINLVRSGAFEPPGPGRHAPPREVLEAREQMIDALSALIGPDAPRLRKPPGFIANLLMSFMFVAGRGGIGYLGTALTPQDLVSILLDGLLREPSYHNGDNRC
jgi:AcrR family transcriptional regulator